MKMFLIKSAWDNITFNKKRNTFSILLIAIASASILLFQGYVEYSKQGMALGFIQKSGNIQIRVKGPHDTFQKDANLLTAKDILQLREFCAQLPEITDIDAVLEFNGIIGTEKNSSIFWGAAYDKPHAVGITAGTPVFADDRAVVLGELLFEELEMDLDNTENFVNIMTTTITGDIATASFDVNGYLATGNFQTDSGLVITSRKAVLDLFELEDSANYLRLFLKNDKDLEKVEKGIQEFFIKHNLNFETANWKQLNPEWEKITGLNTVQFSVVSVILCVLIFVSLTQSLSASFMERIGEFGTMEAIGLKKSSVILLLLVESCMLSLFGIALGVLLSQFGNVITTALKIEWVPPGYTKAYALNFYIDLTAIVITQSFIFITCLIAVVYPIYTVKKYSSMNLINYNGA
ncbi:ABC transporter permease [Treponema phagedenis]|uniref:Efflux ABC transporter, permease protein n=2 Tax=Treponema phagedenis TaxID=162 RepID=A0A0B7H1H0_TREPH|nr:ABC transporter permease [Treponema phagedenis]CEM63065.1 Efflux ABC transporter, permease protein [Treponema phagedenis]